MKQSWKPGTVLYPLPAVLVSCGAAPEEAVAPYLEDAVFDSWLADLTASLEAAMA